MQRISAQQVIEKLQLAPLPAEGGFYRETYRSKLTTQGRSAGTAILYMVTPESFSALHRLKYEEIFHFYAGDAVEMLMIHPDGKHQVVSLGNDVSEDQHPQWIVPAGVWQGTRLRQGGQWALLGTTMAPGFDFADFELGTRDQMTALAPSLGSLIQKYTTA